MLSGKLEKLLDRRFGPIQSMAIRINVGLAGSLAICASFPFTTRTHSSLLWTVMLLGTVSSVAFSTSYQVTRSYWYHGGVTYLTYGSVYRIRVPLRAFTIP